MPDEKTTYASRFAAGVQTGDVLEMITIASQAKASNVRAILERIDTIVQLDSSKIDNLVKILRAPVADGNCGNGCA